jgi:hypothetical protein
MRKSGFRLSLFLLYVGCFAQILAGLNFITRFSYPQSELHLDDAAHFLSAYRIATLDVRISGFRATVFFTSLTLKSGGALIAVNLLVPPPSHHHAAPLRKSDRTMRPD